MHALRAKSNSVAFLSQIQIFATFLWLPRWSSDWESTCGSREFHSWSGKTPHAIEHHNYWVSTPEPKGLNYWTHMLQLLKPVCLEPVLCNRRSNWNETPRHYNQRVVLARCDHRKPVCNNEDPPAAKRNLLENIGIYHFSLLDLVT